MAYGLKASSYHPLNNHNLFYAVGIMWMMLFVYLLNFTRLDLQASHFRLLRMYKLRDCVLHYLDYKEQLSENQSLYNDIGISNL